MIENCFNAKIEKMGGQIVCGPNESCKMRIVQVKNDEGTIFKATAWGSQSEKLRVGNTVTICILPPANPLSKINDYEVLKLK